MFRRQAEFFRATLQAIQAPHRSRFRRLCSEPLESRTLLSAAPIGITTDLADHGPPTQLDSGGPLNKDGDSRPQPVPADSMIYVPPGQEPIPVPEPRFVQTGTKWNQPGGLGAPVTITYSYSNLLDGGLPGGLTENELRVAVEEALAEWAAVAPLNFVEQVDSGPDPSQSDAGYSATNRPLLRFGHHFIDGSSGTNTLAHAFIPGSSGIDGDIHFDNGNTWGTRPNGNVLDLLEVMTHELGHALGLGHEDDVNAIMNSIYARRYSGLGTAFLFQDDIDGIQAVYGTGVGSVTPLPADDNYEPNDTLATAEDPLANGGSWNQRLLSSINGLGVQSDQDWYEINVVQDFQRVTIDAFFSHADGNIDIALFDAAGNLLVESATNTDNERIDYVVGTPGTFLVRVAGDDAGNTYDLTWNRIFSLPLVDSIDSATTAESSVYEFTVAFNRDVSGVDTTDFTLSTTGTVTARIASVNEVSRDTYVVTVDDVSGQGTLQLELIDNDSIFGNLPAAASFDGYDTQLSLVVNPAGTFDLLAEVDPAAGGGLSGVNVDLLNIDSAVNLAPRVTAGDFVLQGFTIGLQDLSGDGSLFAGQNLLNQGSLIYGIGQAVGGTVPDGFTGVNVPWENPLTLATGTWSGATPALGNSRNATLFASVGATAAINAIESTLVANVTPLGGLGVENGNAESDLIDLLVIAPPGDFDLDGDVDGKDFLRWQAGFGTTSGATVGDGDANGDGDVDGDDFLVWQANFGSFPPAGSGAHSSGRRLSLEIDSTARDEALANLTASESFGRRSRRAGLQAGPLAPVADRLTFKLPRSHRADRLFANP